MTEMTPEEMEYYHMHKCVHCGEIKCAVDFPFECEPVAPGISRYCVKCAIRILEESARG